MEEKLSHLQDYFLRLQRVLDRKCSLRVQQDLLENIVYKTLGEQEYLHKEYDTLIKEILRKGSIKKLKTETEKFIKNLHFYTPIGKILWEIHIHQKVSVGKIQRVLYNLFLVDLSFKNLEQKKNPSKKEEMWGVDLTQMEKSILRSLCLRLLLHLEEEDFLTQICLKNGKKLNNFYILGDSKKVFFDQAAFLCYQTFPMICKPDSWTSVSDGGFFFRKNPLVLQKTNQCFHTQPKDAFYKVINKLQTFPFRVNPKSSRFLEMTMKYLTNKLEFINQSTVQEDKNKLEKVFEDMYAGSWAMHFCSKIFYFPWQCDGRGRLYTQISYGFNPITNRLARAILGTSKPYRVDKQGMYWLEVSIASLCDIKGSSEERNAWFHREKDSFLKEITYEHFLKKGIKEESLYSLIFQLMEWQDLQKRPLDRRYSYVLVEKDATSSGFQHNSMFLNHQEGMKLTGLIGKDSSDIYSVLGKACEIEAEDYKFFFTRKCLKHLIMTIPYGSTRLRHKKLLFEYFFTIFDLKVTNLEEILKLPFWLGSERQQLACLLTEPSTFVKSLPQFLKNHFDAILKVLYNVLNRELPFVMDLLKFLHAQNTNLFLENRPYRVETPYLSFENNYFLVKENYCFVRGKGGKKKKMSFYEKTSNVDVNKRRNSICANVIQGLGDAHVIHRLIDNSTNMVFFPIHDSVLVPLNKVEDLDHLVLNSYQGVYAYVRKAGYFKDIEYSQENFKIDSTHIFDF